MPRSTQDRQALIGHMQQLARANSLTEHIRDFLIKSPFPVDIRHNAKIFREKLARWAAGRIRPNPAGSGGSASLH